MEKQSLASLALRQLARRPHIENTNKLPGHLAGDLYSLCQRQASPSSALSFLSSEGFRPSHISLASLALTNRHLQMLSGLADDLVELRITRCSFEGSGAGLVKTFPHIERLLIEDLLDRTGGIGRLLVVCAAANQVSLSGIRGGIPLEACPFNQLVKLELKEVPIKDGEALRTWLWKHQQSLIHLSLQTLCAEREEELVMWRPFFSCRFSHLRSLHIQSNFGLLNLQPALMKRLRIVCPRLLVYINRSDPTCPTVVKWPLIIGTKSERYHLTVAPRELSPIYKEYYSKLTMLP